MQEGKFYGIDKIIYESIFVDSEKFIIMVSNDHYMLPMLMMCRWVLTHEESLTRMLSRWGSNYMLHIDSPHC